jgi:hypothetical protein
MKKQIVTLVFLFITVLASAQKLTIEKGEIKIDEKTVAYIEGKKPFFKVFNLARDYSINAELKFLMDAAGFGKRWLVLKNESGDKFNELEYKKFNPANQEKSFVETLITYNYLDSNGLNVVGLNDFFDKASTGVSEKIKEEENKINIENKKIADLKVVIDDNGVILRTIQSRDTIIGRIKMILNTNGGVQKYEVVDLDNYPIAIWFASQIQNGSNNKFWNQELVAFDGKVFPIKFDNSGNLIGYKMSKDVTARNIVIQLLLNGYLLKYQERKPSLQHESPRVVRE